MQLTTINKIISYLLFGSLATALLIAIEQDYIFDFLSKLKEENINSEFVKSAGVLVPLTFLSVATLLGCIIEGIRSVLVDVAQSRIVPSMPSTNEGRIPLSVKALGVSRTFKGYEYCRDKLFVEAFKHQEQRYPEVSIDSDSSLRLFAVALFFEKSSSESISWVNSHHATYILTSGFLTVTALAGPLWCVHIFQSASDGISCCYVVIWLLILYSLTSFSLRMYLYSYEGVFRQAYIILKDADRSADQESTTAT